MHPRVGAWPQLLGFMFEVFNPEHEIRECQMRRWINVKAAKGEHETSAISNKCVSPLPPTPPLPSRWSQGGLFIRQLGGRFILSKQPLTVSRTALSSGSRGHYNHSWLSKRIHLWPMVFFGPQPLLTRQFWSSCFYQYALLWNPLNIFFILLMRAKYFSRVGSLVMHSFPIGLETTFVHPQWLLACEA
jgi:hypothetical protein